MNWPKNQLDFYALNHTKDNKAQIDLQMQEILQLRINDLGILSTYKLKVYILKEGFLMLTNFVSTLTTCILKTN